MRTFYLRMLGALLLLGGAPAADSQVPPPAPTYADLADLALAAPVAVHVRVADALLLKGAQAAAARPGFARYFIEADVVSLVRAPEGLPARLRYLADLPRDAGGKAPKLRKGTEFILLAAPVPGRPGELRLVAPDAQLPFSVDRATQLRAILTEASGSAAPPRITGIGRAFHVPGSLSGESETQIFLQTAEGVPVSLNVLRRPGETPRWAVALSEIVDEAAEPPARETLLWYRLACTLPRTLPRHSFTDADADAVAGIEADYRFVLEQLGPCARTRAGR